MKGKINNNITQKWYLFWKHQSVIQLEEKKNFYNRNKDLPN
jgi:hypothetical protein